MRMFAAITGIVLFILIAGFVYLYFTWGLDGYLQTAYSIEQLPSDQKQNARNYFYVENSTTYRGTVAKVDTNGYGSVWIWGSQGLKHFIADKDTAFSFYATCDQPLLDHLKNGVDITTDDRTLYTDINSWNKRVQRGYFVEANISTSASGGIAGHLREIYAYDSWWPFEPIILTDICGG